MEFSVINWTAASKIKNHSAVETFVPYLKINCRSFNFHDYYECISIPTCLYSRLGFFGLDIFHWEELLLQQKWVQGRPDYSGAEAKTSWKAKGIVVFHFWATDKEYVNEKEEEEVRAEGALWDKFKACCEWGRLRKVNNLTVLTGSRGVSDP